MCHWRTIGNTIPRYNVIWLSSRISVRRLLRILPLVIYTCIRFASKSKCAGRSRIICRVRPQAWTIRTWFSSVLVVHCEQVTSYLLLVTDRGHWKSGQHVQSSHYPSLIVSRLFIFRRCLARVSSNKPMDACRHRTLIVPSRLNISVEAHGDSSIISGSRLGTESNLAETGHEDLFIS